VLELVDGESLDKRIARGPIPVDEALGIAKQIAEALEAAHEKGIIHRDLKPANIALTNDGSVKVLDFGLAKPVDATSGSVNAMNSPTITSPAMMTGFGVILGTAAYMSPEQAKGRPADKRSDIWAFGCVLFEMLTGTRAFGGQDVSDTLASVLKAEPNWNALPPSAMPLTNVLRLCLEKGLTLRLRDIGDVRLFLSEAGRMSIVSAAPVSSQRGSWIAVAFLLGLVVAGSASALLLRSRSPTVAPRLERFEVMSSQADPFTIDSPGANVAISHDGSRIVYTSAASGGYQLVLRNVDRLETNALAAGENGRDPFFSPDGQQIGFATLSALKRVPANGGPSIQICRLPGVVFSGASWADDSIIFAQAGGSGLFRVSAKGGQPERLVAPDPAKGELNYLSPTILPDGQSVLYTAAMRGGETRIVARSLKDGTTTTVLENGFGARYLPSGHLVYGQNARLMVVPFDISTLRVTGASIVIQENASTKPSGGVANVAVANDGTTLYVAGRTASGSSRVVWVDRDGSHVTPIFEQPLESPRYLRLSPDGRRLALTIGPSVEGNIWVYDLAGGAQPLKLTFQDHNLFPIWSPDGKRIVFISLSAANRVLSIPADGSFLEPESLVTSEEPYTPQDWLPDGRVVLLSRTNPQTRSDLWLLEMSDRKTHPWLQAPFAEGDARFSPDGHWVAYTSDQTGQPEVWVRPFPGSGAPLRVSSVGGLNPVWARDGKDLFYHDSTRMLSARVASTGLGLRIEPPRVLFEHEFEAGPRSPRTFDVAPDGRFIMVERSTAKSSASIVLARNWGEEVKRRVPAK